MKIRQVGQMETNRLTRTEVGATNTESSEVLFRRSFANETNATYLKQIEGMIGNITEQGAIVAKRADMKELQKYRLMVTELLNETVSNGFAFSKSANMSSRGRAKVYATIKKVNDKMDSMTKKLLEQEKENINLLDDVDDIRGLLGDMYL